MTKNFTKDFYEWMADMGNIHYTDDNRMARALEIIVNYEEV
jgi:hypothetical protein